MVLLILVIYTWVDNDVCNWIDWTDQPEKLYSCETNMGSTKELWLIDIKRMNSVYSL